VQAKWDEKDGGWNIQQKSANKWEDISFIKDPTNYKTLALELGYDFTKKDSDNKNTDYVKKFINRGANQTYNK
jgi:hypothetical protein